MVWQTVHTRQNNFVLPLHIICQPPTHGGNYTVCTKQGLFCAYQHIDILYTHTVHTYRKYWFTLDNKCKFIPIASQFTETIFNILKV
jgi:hypothetical protein